MTSSRDGTGTRRETRSVRGAVSTRSWSQSAVRGRGRRQASMSSTVAVLLCALLGSWTHVWGSQVFTQCPDKHVQQHFDNHRFQGKWYEVQRQQPNPFEPNSVCVTGHVTANADGTMAIVNKWYNTATSQQVVLNGIIRKAKNGSDDGKMIVNFPNIMENDYSVLATDYTNYTVLWSCTKTGENEYTGYTWILGRSKVLSADAWSAVHAVEEREAVDTSLFEYTRHTDCPAAPLS